MHLGDLIIYIKNIIDTKLKLHSKLKDLTQITHRKFHLDIFSCFIFDSI